MPDEIITADATAAPATVSALETLKKFSKWVAWKQASRNGKSTKIPINPHTGRAASVADPATWGTYDEAVARARQDRLAGVGFVLTADDGLTGGDLDKVRNAETGEIVSWAAEIVALNETYCEVSPSGTGLRFFWLGKIAATVKNDQMQVEVYRDGRYLTVTGNRIEGTPDEIRPAPLTEAALCARAATSDQPISVVDGRTDDDAAHADSSWKKLNSAALKALDAWVPELFGTKAERQWRSGGFRISSRSLGRDLEEDLSISPMGIKDFGVHDQGDERQGRRTPIDLVMEYGDKDFYDAAEWLCEKLGRELPTEEELAADELAADTAMYDYIQDSSANADAYMARFLSREKADPEKADPEAPPQSEAPKVKVISADLSPEQAPAQEAVKPKVTPPPQSEAPKPKAKPIISATPFDWVIPPPRRWLYRPHYIRKFCSLTVSTGGIGKSALMIAEAMAMTSNKALLGTRPEQPLRVWYWNGEDPLEELQRRFAATAKHFELEAEHIGDRLFVDSGRVMEIVLTKVSRRGDVTIAEPVVELVIATLIENKIDVLMIDPFVSCHRANENDNAAIERVAKTWSYIADKTNCSVMLAHHSRKTGDAVTVDDGRGASALLAAVRVARTLNNMQEKEAENAGVPVPERRAYIRIDLGKTNLTAAAEKVDWIKFVSVPLDNGEGLFGGDKVGVVTAWDYPQATAPSDSMAQVRRVQEAIKAGGPWREDRRSITEPWVGIVIARELGLDLQSPPTKRRVVTLVRDWLVNGWLLKIETHDARRVPRTYIEAGEVPPDTPF